MSGSSKRVAPSPPALPIILFTVGEFTMGVPAREVDEACDARSSHAWNGQDTTVIDTREFFHADTSGHPKYLVLHAAPVALAVDSVSRIAEVDEIIPLPRAFTGQERRWYRGLAMINGEVVPVLNAAVFYPVGWKNHFDGAPVNR